MCVRLFLLKFISLVGVDGLVSLLLKMFCSLSRLVYVGFLCSLFCLRYVVWLWCVFCIIGLFSLMML